MSREVYIRATKVAYINDKGGESERLTSEYRRLASAKTLFSRLVKVRGEELI